MRKTVDTRPLFLLGRKRAPRAYKGLGTRLGLHRITGIIASTGANYFKEVCRYKFEVN